MIGLLGKLEPQQGAKPPALLFDRESSFLQ